MPKITGPVASGVGFKHVCITCSVNISLALNTWCASWHRWCRHVVTCRFLVRLVPVVATVAADAEGNFLNVGS